MRRYIPFIFMLLMMPSSGFALGYRVHTDVLSQIREDENGVREIPFNGYVGGGVGNLADRVSLETDMRIFRDVDQSLDDYDLYDAVIHTRPFERWTVDAGRQFISQGFSAEVIDGIQTTVTPWQHLNVSAYAGVPRTVERGDFNRDDGLLSGLSLRVIDLARMTIGFHGAWRRFDLNTTDWRQNDEVRTGTDVTVRLPGGMKPLLYGLVEYDATAKIIDTGTAGIDLFPHRRVALNTEFNYFNVNRDANRRTIQSLFTSGETMGGRFSTTVTIVPDELDLVGSYSYQRLEIQQGVHENGHIANGGFQVVFEDIGLFLSPEYYFRKSFGGDLHGVRSSVREEFTEKLWTEIGADFTTYNKITGNDDQAISTVAWAGYTILKGWSVSAGFEYNRNNNFDRDIRGSFRMSYDFAKKS